MNRYETYKPSGIDWIGEVPHDWKTLRIKNVASIVNGSTPSSSVEEFWDGDIIWATPGDFNKFDKIIDDSESKITEAGYKSCGTSLVPVGSVVITTRAPIGNVLIAGKELCTNQGCKTLVPNRVESRFLYYIISISSIELNILGQGTTFLELSKESLGTFKLPLPGYNEQLAIANYLDDQTQKIDRLIANKKVQAEKLKELRQIEINHAVTKGLNPNAEMKDSGIEWLGKIPKHWAEKRLKNLVSPKITDGPHETPELVDDIDGIPFISAEAITENGINYEARGGNISVEQDRIYSLKCKPKRDDIFMVKSGSTTGRIGYVDSVLNFNIWSPLALIRANSNTNSRFLYFALCSNYIQKQVQLTWSFGTQPNIGMGVIERLRLVIPPKEEQIVIAKYLMQRTTAIDQLIKNIEAQIEKLQELRKIKIYEAVTGKIKVNAYAETTA